MGTSKSSQATRPDAAKDEAARKVIRLLRAGLKDAPPTDIRASAFEACDELEALLGPTS